MISLCTRSLHNQLLQEGPSESFVKKRVDLLKTQVVQLERQVARHNDHNIVNMSTMIHTCFPHTRYVQIVLLTQALSSRTELMVDLQVMLESLLGSLEYVHLYPVISCTLFSSSWCHEYYTCRENVKEEGKGQVLKLVSVLNDRLMKHSQVQHMIGHTMCTFCP